MMNHGEQPTVNSCLKSLNVTWTKHTKVQDICSNKSGWKSNDAPISIYVFSQQQFCRGCCNSKNTDGLYNVHPLRSTTVITDKFKGQKSMKTWFLKESWENLINSTAKGDEWLQNISTIELEN